MKKNSSTILIALIVFTTWSCNKDDKPKVDLLGSLTKGSGTVMISGNESFSYENIEFSHSEQYEAFINSEEYAGVDILIGETQSAVYFELYIPIVDGRSIPENGDLPIFFKHEQQPNICTCAYVRVIGTEDTYETSIMTTGTFNILNAQLSTNSFDVIFNLQNLSVFEGDAVVSLTGALRF